MDYLQEGIGLRAMAQRDPLVEYQREGFELFAAMMDAIKEESVGYVFNAEVEVEEAAPQKPTQLVYTAPSESGETSSTVAREDGTPRSAPCPCGSGRKYKRCHGDPRNR